MTLATYDHLDGNAAAGELSSIFAIDVTAAEGQCANCGATKRFAEAYLYMHGPGVVARCAVCDHVLLRLVNVRHRVFLDVRGLTYLSLDTAQVQV
jgi:Family of unknown function (DUF6510)